MTIINDDENLMRKIQPAEFPGLLMNIPKEEMPESLWMRGVRPPMDYKYVCIVGSRAPSPYGKEVCRMLLEGLRGLPIVIVSGLAIGIDSLAHKCALEFGLKTIAFPGSGLNHNILYPKHSLRLAEDILDAGGALFSEFSPERRAEPYMFPQRNRLMAGTSHLSIVIEAKEKSGSLITTKFATNYFRDVGAVPGSVFSHLSAGPHLLLSVCANPIRNSGDIIALLGLDTYISETEKFKYSDDVEEYEDLSPDELLIIKSAKLTSKKDEIIRDSTLSPSRASVAISLLLIKEILTEEEGNLFLKK
ncbi:MAG: DNA-protecting protein DprA [Candidatus Taylorbacteria bacterium]|nr:DNA-protecting protein DprA [Candidatus Taylorbacteria bacterium]